MSIKINTTLVADNGIPIPTGTIVNYYRVAPTTAGIRFFIEHYMTETAKEENKAPINSTILGSSIEVPGDFVYTDTPTLATAADAINVGRDLLQSYIESLVGSGNTEIV